MVFMNRNETVDDMSISDDDNENTPRGTMRAVQQLPDERVLQAWETELLQGYQENIRAQQLREQQQQQQQQQSTTSIPTSIFGEDSSEDDESTSSSSSDEDEEDTRTQLSVSESMTLPRFFPAPSLVEMKDAFRHDFHVYAKAKGILTDDSRIPVWNLECSLVQNDALLHLALYGPKKIVQGAREFASTVWATKRSRYTNWRLTRQKGVLVVISDLEDPLGVRLDQVYANIKQLVALEVVVQDQTRPLATHVQSFACVLLETVNGIPVSTYGEYRAHKEKQNGGSGVDLEVRCLPSEYANLLWGLNRVEREREWETGGSSATTVKVENEKVKTSMTRNMGTQETTPVVNENTTTEDVLMELDSDSDEEGDSDDDENEETAILAPTSALGASAGSFVHFRAKVMAVGRVEFNGAKGLKVAYETMWANHKSKFTSVCRRECQCIYQLPYLTQGVTLPTGILGNFAATLMPHVRAWYPGRPAVEHVHHLVPLWQHHTKKYGKHCKSGCPCESAVESFRQVEFKSLAPSAAAFSIYSWSHFSSKFQDVLSEEYGKSNGKSNTRKAMSHSWKHHKTKHGPTCNEHCPCASDLTWIQEAVQNNGALLSDPPVGFATEFASRFLPALVSEFPDESHAYRMIRLVEMWKLHTIHVRYGKRCQANCQCREAWEQTFKKGHLVADPPPPTASPQGQTLCRIITANDTEMAPMQTETSQSSVLNNQNDDQPVGSVNAETPTNNDDAPTNSTTSSPKPPRQWDVFVDKFRRLVEIEFHGTGVHFHRVAAGMWKKHKILFGPVCSEDCRCCQHIGDLTKSLIRDLRDEKDPKVPGLTGVADYPVGFAGNFADRFLPKIAAEKADESALSHLQRLGRMWEIHRREFGTACNSHCKCKDGWEVLFEQERAQEAPADERKGKASPDLGDSQESAQQRRLSDISGGRQSTPAILHWHSFEEKHREPIELEFATIGVHCKKIAGYLWRTHKAKFGTTCDDNCPCAGNLPTLTEALVSDLRANVSDPKIPSMEGCPDYPVGFAGSFAGVFLPKLAAEYDSESPARHLERLVRMWKVHTTQFGTQCGYSCKCKENAETLIIQIRDENHQGSVPRKRKSLESDATRPLQSQNETLSSPTLSSQPSTKKVAGDWNYFSGALMLAAVTEFKSSAHGKAVLGQMWRKHKILYGLECGSRCPCADNLPGLTESVISDLKKDPKWASLTCPDYPVGFAGPFAKRFQARLASKHAEESPKQRLERLLKMWKNHLHKVGSTCGPNCNCEDAWETILVRGETGISYAVPRKQNSLLFPNGDDLESVEPLARRSASSPNLGEIVPMNGAPTDFQIVPPNKLLTPTAEDSLNSPSDQSPSTTDSSRIVPPNKQLTPTAEDSLDSPSDQSPSTTDGNQGWSHFFKKIEPVVMAEYGDSGIHSKAALGQMWVKHKELYSNRCDSSCLCAVHLQSLTQSLVHDLKKTKRWSHLDCRNYPVGFASAFANRFLPKLASEYKDDSAEKRLERLLKMWHIHRKQRRYGTECSLDCDCADGWEIVFNRGALEFRDDIPRKRKSLDTQQGGNRGAPEFQDDIPRKRKSFDTQQGGKPIIAVERNKHLDMTYEKAFDSFGSLGIYFVTERKTLPHYCKVISNNPFLDSVDHRITLGTAAVSSKIGDGEWVALHSHFDLKKQFGLARDQKVSIKFNNKHVTERERTMCNTYAQKDWSKETGLWRGICKSGWDGQLKRNKTTNVVGTAQRETEAALSATHLSPVAWIDDFGRKRNASLGGNASTLPRVEYDRRSRRGSTTNFLPAEGVGTNKRKSEDCRMERRSSVDVTGSHDGALPTTNWDGRVARKEANTNPEIESGPVQLEGAALRFSSVDQVCTFCPDIPGLPKIVTTKRRAQVASVPTECSWASLVAEAIQANVVGSLELFQSKKFVALLQREASGAASVKTAIQQKMQISPKTDPSHHVLDLKNKALKICISAFQNLSVARALKSRERFLVSLKTIDLLKLPSSVMGTGHTLKVELFSKKKGEHECRIGSFCEKGLEQVIQYSDEEVARPVTFNRFEEKQLLFRLSAVLPNNTSVYLGQCSISGSDIRSEIHSNRIRGAVSFWCCADTKSEEFATRIQIRAKQDLFTDTKSKQAQCVKKLKDIIDWVGRLREQLDAAIPSPENRCSLGRILICLLESSIFAGDVECVKKLLELGADPRKALRLVQNAEEGLFRHTLLIMDTEEYGNSRSGDSGFVESSARQSDVEGTKQQAVANNERIKITEQNNSSRKQFLEEVHLLLKESLHLRHAGRNDGSAFAADADLEPEAQDYERSQELANVHRKKSQDFYPSPDTNGQRDLPRRDSAVSWEPPLASELHTEKGRHGYRDLPFLEETGWLNSEVRPPKICRYFCKDHSCRFRRRCLHVHIHHPWGIQFADLLSKAYREPLPMNEKIFDLGTVALHRTVNGTLWWTAGYRALHGGARFGRPQIRNEPQEIFYAQGGPGAFVSSQNISWYESRQEAVAALRDSIKVHCYAAQRNFTPFTMGTKRYW